LVIEALTVGVHINYLSVDGITRVEQCDGDRFSKAIDASRFTATPTSLIGQTTLPVISNLPL
jgi:hypothetical protein